MSAPFSVVAFVASVLDAEAQALADHEAGLCHLSEWSCSHCRP